MMAREQDISETYNPWPKIGWATTAGIVVVSAVLGFGLLDRYQQAGPTLSVWSAICRGLGISSGTESTAEPQPTLRTPTRIAWTNATLDQIKAGDVKHGAFVTLVCTACHGEHGISQSALYPTLAGMDAATVYKQLDDFRSGKRSWGAMNAIAQALSLHDSADAAVYFAAQPDGLPALTGDRAPESGRSLRQSDPAKRLIFAGAPERGIPPCSACHGPGGYKLGAPALQGQQANYIEEQLLAFAQGMRQNDVFEQMRIIARQLTSDEMHAVAAFYAPPVGAPRVVGIPSR